MRAFCLLVLAGVLAGCQTTTPIAQPYGAPASIRTLPQRLMDEGIERVLMHNMSHWGLDDQNARVAIDSFFGDVLLTGEVPDAAFASAIESYAISLPDVRRVYNRLQVTPAPKTLSYSLQENYLKSKIGAVLLKSQLNRSEVKVVVRSGVAYLMGRLDANQAQKASLLVANVAGVMTVVPLFDSAVFDAALLTQEPKPNAPAFKSAPKTDVPKTAQGGYPPVPGYVSLYGGAP